MKVSIRIILCVVLSAAFLPFGAHTSAHAGPKHDHKKTKSEKKASVNADIDDSQVIISLDDKVLTMEQVRWITKNTTTEVIKKIARNWLQNELMYEEAIRLGIVDNPRIQFLAEREKKAYIVHRLTAGITEKIKVTEKDIRGFYEANKARDKNLIKAPILYSFSHVTTKTLEQAKQVLQRINNGENINKLARELSIHRNASRGGAAPKYPIVNIKIYWGEEFFKALQAAEEGQIIGPIKNKEGNYEVARHEGRRAAVVKSFDESKEWIKNKVLALEASTLRRELSKSLVQEAKGRVKKSHIITGKK